MSNKSQSAALSKAESVFTASQQRDETIRQEIAKERAQLDAKTARLKALRLAKEAADREAGIAAEAEAGPKKRTRKKTGA
jgi:hypothetical protein